MQWVIKSDTFLNYTKIVRICNGNLVVEPQKSLGKTNTVWKKSTNTKATHAKPGKSFRCWHKVILHAFVRINYQVVLSSKCFSNTLFFEHSCYRYLPSSLIIIKGKLWVITLEYEVYCHFWLASRQMQGILKKRKFEWFNQRYLTDQSMLGARIH